MIQKILCIYYFVVLLRGERETKCVWDTVSFIKLGFIFYYIVWSTQKATKNFYNYYSLDVSHHFSDLLIELRLRFNWDNATQL